MTYARNPGAAAHAVVHLRDEGDRGDEQVTPLVTQLPWTHNLIILTQAKRAEEREFYLRLPALAANGPWSAAAPARAGISRDTMNAKASCARRAAVKIAVRSPRNTCNQASM